MPVSTGAVHRSSWPARIDRSAGDVRWSPSSSPPDDPPKDLEVARPTRSSGSRCAPSAHSFHELTKTSGAPRVPSAASPARPVAASARRARASTRGRCAPAAPCGRCCPSGASRPGSTGTTGSAWRPRRARSRRSRRCGRGRHGPRQGLGRGSPCRWCRGAGTRPRHRSPAHSVRYRRWTGRCRGTGPGSPRRTASARRSDGEAGRVRHETLAIDEQQRPAVDADVARVLEVGHEVVEDGQVAHAVVVLGHEHVLLAPVPAARPGLVGPAQGERQVRLPILEHQLEGPLQQPTTAEPVEVVAEAVDAVLSGELRLGRAHIP